MNVNSRPIAVAVDSRTNIAYVRYRAGRATKTIDVWLNGRVRAEFGADDQIIGIALFGLDASTVLHARHFATTHNLAFPVVKVR